MDSKNEKNELMNAGKFVDSQTAFDFLRINLQTILNYIRCIEQCLVPQFIWKRAMMQT